MPAPVTTLYASAGLDHTLQCVDHATTPVSSQAAHILQRVGYTTTPVVSQGGAHPARCGPPHYLREVRASCESVLARLPFGTARL